MSQRSNQTVNLLRASLYQLKFEYGTRIAVNKLIVSEVDPRTGVRHRATDRYVIPRAVKLPEVLKRETHQSISTISANKQLVMGGTVDFGGTTFIVDRRDCELPTLTADDWIDEDGDKYQISHVEDLLKCGWVIKARRVAGESVDPISGSASSQLGVDNDVSES